MNALKTEGKNRYFLIPSLILFSFLSFSLGAVAEVEGTPEPPPEAAEVMEAPTVDNSYTMLAEMRKEYRENFFCSVVVMLNFNQAEVKVIRLQDRGKRRDANDFRKNPEWYGLMGKSFDLTKLFPELPLESLKRVEARFGKHKKKVKDNSDKVLHIVAISNDNERFKAKRNISHFFEKAPPNCLK